MGVLSSSVSLSRYKIQESDNEPLIQGSAVDLLRQRRFQSIDNTVDVQSFGWVNIDDMLDVDFSTSPPEKGDYLAFSLRIDTRRVPSAVLKKHVAIAMKEALERANEQGQKFLTKERKEEIRELVTLKLLAKTMPVPATFDVVVDEQKGTVLFASTQPKVMELFEELFESTFGSALEPQLPFYVAINAGYHDAVIGLSETAFASGGE